MSDYSSGDEQPKNEPVIDEQEEAEDEPVGEDPAISE